jgi:hypothetical protein
MKRERRSMGAPKRRYVTKAGDERVSLALGPYKEYRRDEWKR